MNKNKFRGKRIDNGRWEFGNVINCASGEKTYIFPIGSYANESLKIGEEGCLRLVTMEVDPETVGQYTGLKDKNGKEIYEGDIVELTNTYRDMNSKSIVEISFENYSFVGKWAEEYSPSGYVYNPLGSYNFPIVLIEVIGNIYENSELFREEKIEMVKRNIETIKSHLKDYKEEINGAELYQQLTYELSIYERELKRLSYLDKFPWGKLNE